MLYLCFLVTLGDMFVPIIYIYKDPYERTYRITRDFCHKETFQVWHLLQVSTWRFNFLFDPQKDFFAQVVLGGEIDGEVTGALCFSYGWYTLED